ncbi:SCO family protein [Paenibacillus filicis]|uniref:SCO family protein n=1 Tax=Paenibacillus filicis TaxID=669464 RepID=A0ABU9DUC0_9BACL
MRRWSVHGTALVSGIISPQTVLRYGIALGIAGLSVLWLLVQSPLATLLSLIGLFTYVWLLLFIILLISHNVTASRGPDIRQRQSPTIPRCAPAPRDLFLGEKESKRGMNMPNNAFKIVVMVLLVGLIGTFSYMLLQGQSKDEKMGILQKAPDFKLQNLDGKEVSLADTAGKAKLVYFFFSTCPDVCPPSTFTLSKIQNELIKKGVFGTDTAIMSISFDPTKDTTERLKEFSSRYNPDYKGWYFLRGDEKETVELARKFGVLVEKDTKNDSWTHSNLFLLVDGKGNLRTYYSGHDENLDVQKVAADLIKISKEK